MYVCIYTVAQFCVNNWGDDIPARYQQFWGGYKLLHSTLLSLGGPSPFPSGNCASVHIYIYIYIYSIYIYIYTCLYVCMV